MWGQGMGSGGSYNPGTMGGYGGSGNGSGLGQWEGQFGQGMGNYMNMASSPWYQGMMGAGGLLGGIMGQQGANQMSGDIQQGMNAMQNASNQGVGYLQPWQQAGQQALGQFGQFNQQMSNPSQYVNGIMSGYQISPAAQFQMQQMQNQMNNSAADSGNLGSPSEQKAMMQYGNGIVAQNQQQYLGNVLGVGNQYENNLGTMMGQGLNAAQGMNQNRMSLGNNLGQMYQNMGMAGMNGDQSMGGGLGSMLGGLGGMFGSGMFGGGSGGGGGFQQGGIGQDIGAWFGL